MKDYPKLMRTILDQIKAVLSKKDKRDEQKLDDIFIRRLFYNQNLHLIKDLSEEQEDEEAEKKHF